MSHTTGPLAKISPSTASEVVEDYLLVPQDDPNRPAVYGSGDLYTFLATSRETNFAFNFFDFFLPVNAGPSPHYHRYEHEVWYVTAGEIEYTLGNEGTDTLVVPEGTLVFGPRNRVHGYHNIDSTASISGITPGARTLSMTTPGALDLFFDTVAGQVTDRNQPVPTLPNTVEVFTKLAEFALRTNAGITIATPDYQPPENALNYLLVLPPDAEGDVVEGAIALSKVDGFSVWTTGEQAGLRQRPKFTGPFGIEYTSLASLEETGNEFSYNQFSLAPQVTNTFAQANLNANQEVKHTESLATGVATVKLNEQGDIDYNLTVTGLNFEKFAEWGTSQTPENKDDVTGIYIDSGDRGSNGSHVFNILDPSHQDASYQSLRLNPDGSTTINGTWRQADKEIPTTLSDFLAHSGLPGQQSNFYLEVDTSDHPTGEIRGQIASTTNDFADPVESENDELLYVNKGQLSVKIGDETRLAGPDTFVYIAPGNKYSLSNFGDAEVDSLAISVIPRQYNGPVIPDDTGYNLIEGSGGDDILFANSKDKLVGGAGNDIYIVNGGNNLLYAGSGADQFWIANGKIPDTVPDPRQITDQPAPFPTLPPLEDTQNTIINFKLGIDKIYINGINGISSFDDLKLLPAFGDLRTTSILATLDGKEISLANVSGILSNELSARDFVFA